MYILNLWSDVKYSILVAIRTLFLDLCSAIYKLIVYTCDIFFSLGEAKILDDPTIQGIYTRVGLILGLFMVFRLTFAGVQYLIDPDTMLDKQKGIGNIVKKVLLVVLLLGSTQYIFKKAYEIQHLIIEDNVLSRIILQESSQSESKGGEIAYQLFIPFFQPNSDVVNYCNNNNNCQSQDNNYNWCMEQLKPELEGSVSVLKSDFQKTPPSLTVAYICSSEVVDLPIVGNSDNKTQKEFIVNFEGFVALATGMVVLWTIMTYTIQVGVRAIQLAYLQLIAPIPIMMYLTPKGDETLKKWAKQCTTTFFDFFIRAAIFYFIILVIGALETTALRIDYNKSWTLGYLYIKVVLIIALLVFAKKVPNLLKEIFPSTGGAASFGFGLKMPDEAKKVGLFGTGAILGASGAAASNALHSIYNGVQGVKDAKGKGNKWKAGLKGFGAGALSVAGGAVSGFTKGARIKNMRGIGETVRTTNSNRDKRDLKQAAGYKPWNAVGDKVLGFAGLDTKADTMIKEAQWQQQAAEASRGAIWKNAEDSVKNGSLTYEDYSFARSLKQDKDKSGNTIWRGLDKSGKEIIIKDADLKTQFALRTTSGIDLTKEIRDNAAVDKRIKDEGKKIKGLEAANDSAKK